MLAYTNDVPQLQLKDDCYENKQNFKHLISSCPPLMADYFRSLALAFQDLKYSPNCVLREYYLAANYRCRAAASVAKSERTFPALCVAA